MNVKIGKGGGVNAQKPQGLTKIWREVKKPFARLYYIASARKAGISAKTFAHFEMHRNTIAIGNDGKVTLPYLEIDIAIGCNLKCVHCSHLSPFRKGIVPADDVIHWFQLWSEKIAPKKLNLLGGEPLLHPELPRILRETKRIWSQTEIGLVSNGFMFSKVSADVFEALEETQISVTISDHSANESERRAFIEAVSRLRNHSFAYKIRKSNRKWRVQYNQTTEGIPTMFSSDPKTAWDICTGKTCIALAHNKLYKCAVLASIIEGVSETTFSPAHWSSALTYKPLTLEADSQEIAEHLSRRQVPACSICPAQKILVKPQQITTQH
jgi:organic radical activating enzyme